MDTLNWISNMVKIKEDITISDLILPGSHNSASYAVRPGKRVRSMTFDSSAEYQRDTIYEQLKKGIRMLHTRVLLDKRTKRLRTYSKSQNVDFDTVLKQIKAFSVLSKDVIFIRLIARDSSAARGIKDSITSTFGSASVEYTDANLLLKTKIKDLLSAKTRIIFIGCDVRITHLESVKSSETKTASSGNFDVLLYQRKPIISFKSRENVKLKTNETFDKFVFLHGEYCLKQINTVLFDFATCNDNITRLILMCYLRCGIIR